MPLNFSKISEHISFKYLQFIRRYFYSNKNVIKSLNDYKKNNLESIDYKLISEKFHVHFTEDESRYFKEDILTSKQILKDHVSGYEHKSSYICKLKNTRFFGSSGAIFYEGKLVEESIFNEKRSVKAKVIDSVFIKKIYKQGAYTSIMNLPWSENNLFHWNIDCLPRLLPITKNKRKKNTFYMQ